MKIHMKKDTLKNENPADTKPMLVDGFKELAEWLLIHKRSVFMDANIPKDSKRKIMNELGYSSNSLND